jgi:hypothetical protein
MPPVPELPILYPEDDDESPDDEAAVMSESEIDAVNRRIPDLVAKEQTADEPEAEAVDDSVETTDIEDRSASASGG